MRPLLPLLCFITLSLTAQSTSVPRVHEIGVRMSGLDDFDLMYKKSLDDAATYRRYRLFFSELSYLNVDGTSVGTLNVGASIGRERRSAVTDRLQFNRGPELFASLQYLGVDGESQLTLSPGVGYVLGLQYNLSDEFYLGIETIPSVSLRVGVGEPTIVGFNAGFNSSALSVLAMYRFSR